MPKRYCGQVAIEMRADDRPGWECFTCFISARDPERPGSRGKSICFVNIPFPVQISPHMWEDMAERALRNMYTADPAKLDLFRRALNAGGFKDHKFVVRRNR
jgi:hypothetical protein